jgi:non-heme chloroperoxidase
VSVVPGPFTIFVMRQGAVTVDGDVTSAYCEMGDGPPVVCLPGWSQAAEQFVPVMEQLAPGHRMVAFDHRGHGRSSQPGRGYRLHRLAADLHEALSTLDLGDFTLLGHSMGVAVIWAYLDVFGDDGIDRLIPPSRGRRSLYMAWAA